MLAIRVESPHSLSEFGLDGNYNHGLPPMKMSRLSQWKAFGGDGTRIVYSGLQLDVTAVQVERQVSKPVAAAKDVNIEFQLAARNFRLTDGLLTIPAAQFLID